MRENYALRYLRQLVDWDDGKLEKEVGWLRRIAAYKFDGYQDFFAGERFISALIRWLNQFEPADRDFAYSILRNHLTFLSAGEIQHLVRRTVPAHFRPLWIKRVATERNIPPYEVWATAESAEAYRRLVRRTLFIGLSDGARIDTFRRSNVGVLSNEQVVVSYELSTSKLDSLVKELKEHEKSETARFEMVFLIDDFLGSGTTLCRLNKEGIWKGKIEKFGAAIERDCPKYFSTNFDVVAHHYIATNSGLVRAASNLSAFSSGTSNPYLKNKTVALTADLRLTDANKFPQGADLKMDAFLMKYYDPGIMTKSLWEGGCEVHNGFANGGLVLVLEHNTPNNSLGILWAHSNKRGDSHVMRPLFRRRQRHD